MRNKKGIVSKLGIFIVLMSAVCMTGCASFVKALVESGAGAKKISAPNKIFLHSNPQVGDFMKFESFGTTIQESNVKRGTEIVAKSIREYKITEINGDMITVTFTTHFDSSSNGSLLNKMDMELNTVMKYVVDFDGNVKESYFVTKKGKEIATKILQPGMSGYFDFDYSSLPITKFKDKSGVETECYLYEQVMDMAKVYAELGKNPDRNHVNGYSKTRYFISKNPDSVKFRLLGAVEELDYTMDDYHAGSEYEYFGTQIINSKTEMWMVENGNKNEK